jgi:hypothetical protein
MRSISGFALSAVIAIYFTGVAGCDSGKRRSPTGGTSAGAHGHSHDHGHSHHHGHSHDPGHAHGPHGGHIVALGSEDYYAEVTHAVPQTVGIHILGPDAATAAPISAASVTIYASADGEVSEYVLPAAPPPDEPSGKSSYFELKNEQLHAVIAGGSPSLDSQPRISFMVDGLPYAGTIDTQLDQHYAAAQTHSHAADDALIWRKELKAGGYDIALGHHGISLLAGAEVEPAVRISHEGQPVADAKAFTALLAENGRTVLANEVSTVYEPPTDDEPAHYAQGRLKIPPGTRQAAIRYRIVLPDNKTEYTFDFPVSVK